MVCYAKSLSGLNAAGIEWRERKQGIDRIYDAYKRLAKKYGPDWVRVSDELQGWYRGLKPFDPAREHEHYHFADERGVYFASDISGPDDGRKSRPRYEVSHPVTGKPVPIPARGWSWEKPKMDRELAKGRVHFGPDETSVPNIKVYLRENEYQAPSSVFYQDRRAASALLKEIMGEKVFDFPKDYRVLERIAALLLTEHDTLLDFFAGTCSSAQAVMQLNRDLSKSARFVMVQIPEPVEADSRAGAAGFASIADIGKERIRRVLTGMKQERSSQMRVGEGAATEDLGVRVFKLSVSNMKPWKGADEKDPEKYAKTMEMFLDPLVEGWKPENVIAEVALKEAGFGLNCRVEEVEPQMNADERRLGSEPKPKTSVGVNRRASAVAPTVYRVTDEDKEQFFYICLDDKVRLEDVKFLNLTRDMLFVCRDVALDDETAANLALQCRLRTI
jgi:adenine-specific DNA-methyltransferase